MMIRLLYIIIGVLLLAGCHQDEDDIFATATITLTADDGMTIERVQGTARITNLNSKQVITTSDFDVATLNLQLLRSSYSVDVEGLVRYRNADGEVSTKSMRAHSDYLALDKKGHNEAMLTIIFLE